MSDRPRSAVRTIGLMSGTSLDGIDAALVRFDGPATGDVEWSVEAFLETPFRPEQRAEILHAIDRGSAQDLCRLNVQLGEWFADAVLDVCERAGRSRADIDAIGSHGQTVWHEPPSPQRPGATLQLGCAATIAERTGIPVVADFRSRDVAAGGHGAPLVPWADRLLFAHAQRSRALINVGGMANVTRVPARGSADPLIGFDTGPGNAPINAAVEIATEGAALFDRDGELALSGSVNEALLGELRADPYFDLAPPKSTGRERFGRAYVQRVASTSGLGGADLVATMTALSARTIADAITRWIVPAGVDEVVVTGGGARNHALMTWLTEAIAPLPVTQATTLGLDPDAKEAVAFAALAWAHLLGVAGNVPEVTGALGARVLGSLTPGASERGVP